MNYKIKATVSDVVIGANTITTDGFYLVALDIANAQEGATLIAELGAGNLQLLEGEAVVTEFSPIVSNFIDLELAINKASNKLSFDYKSKDKLKEAKAKGIEYIAEAQLYTERRIKGQILVDVETAILVTEKQKGNVSEAQVKKVGELALNGLLEANAGHWKTAYSTLDTVVNDANFTNEDATVQAYVTGYRDAILSKIPELYPNG